MMAITYDSPFTGSLRTSTANPASRSGASMEPASPTTTMRSRSADNSSATCATAADGTDATEDWNLSNSSVARSFATRAVTAPATAEAVPNRSGNVPRRYCRAAVSSSSVYQRGGGHRTLHRGACGEWPTVSSEFESCGSSIGVPLLLTKHAIEPRTKESTENLRVDECRVEERIEAGAAESTDAQLRLNGAGSIEEQQVRRTTALAADRRRRISGRMRLTTAARQRC
jgi:hypothetical protein